MPSSKLPSALGIGPGKLPANVVTSAALLALPGASSSSPAVPNLGIVSIVQTVSLSNGKPVTYALVDNRSRIYAIAGSLLVDGQTFTLNDGTHAATVFEFDSNASVTPGNVAVTFTGADSDATVATAIRTAINGVGAGLNVVAEATTGTTGHIVPLTNGADINIGFLETVANAGFKFFPDTANTVYNIGLPPSPNVGDVLHLVAEGNGTNAVLLTGTVNGSANGEFVGGPYGAQSYIASAAGWTTLGEKPTVQSISVTTSLRRVSKSLTALVDTTGGNVSITLPAAPLIGDRVTVLKSVAANRVTVLGVSALDTIDGRAGNVGASILGVQASITLVRVANLTWATVSEALEVVEITDAVTLGASAAREICVLVHTLDPAWAAGTKTVGLPAFGQVRTGTIISISDVDGNAALNPITISAGNILGVTPATSFTFSSQYGSVELKAKTGGAAWLIAAENRGLVEDFTSLSRVDSRVDGVIARFDATPMFNWNQRKVALHAEFNGLITNVLPVEGFSAGGSMTLASGPSANGTVGVMRCTVPLGLSGYLHLGSLPTDDLFDPAQLLGFRAILSLVTTNPGTDYDVAIGFGDDISDTSSTDDLMLGANSLYLTTSSGGAWRKVRQASGAGVGTNLSAITAGARYVVEYYFSGAAWDAYINGVRSAGAATNVPTAMLNFGMVIRDDGGGAVPLVVDIDSITIFTLDMGATRHNP